MKLDELSKDSPSFLFLTEKVINPKPDKRQRQNVPVGKMPSWPEDSVWMLEPESGLCTYRLRMHGALGYLQPRDRPFYRILAATAVVETVEKGNGPRKDSLRTIKAIELYLVRESISLQDLLRSLFYLNQVKLTGMHRAVSFLRNASEETMNQFF